MAKKKTPTARTLEALRADGYLTQVVERWVPQAMKRIDLFGCIDLVSIQGVATVGIQACAGASHSERVKKAKAEPRLVQWLSADGNKFEVWSWKKKGARGKRKLWEVRIEQLVLSEDRKSVVSLGAHTPEPQQENEEDSAEINLFT